MGIVFFFLPCFEDFIQKYYITSNLCTPSQHHSRPPTPSQIIIMGVHIHIYKYSLLNPSNVACMCVF